MTQQHKVIFILFPGLVFPYFLSAFLHHYSSFLVSLFGYVWLVGASPNDNCIGAPCSFRRMFQESPIPFPAG